MPEQSPPGCAIFWHRRVPALRSLLSTSVLQPHSALPSVGRTGCFTVLSPLRQSHHCRQGAANPSTRNETVAGYAQWSSFRHLPRLTARPDLLPLPSELTTRDRESVDKGKSTYERVAIEGCR